MLIEALILMPPSEGRTKLVTLGKTDYGLGQPSCRKTKPHEKGKPHHDHSFTDYRIILSSLYIGAI